MGREDALAELLRAVETGGATITGVQGMGGVGKTALAYLLAERVQDRCPDQIVFDLRGADEQQPAATADAMRHVILSYEPAVRLPDDFQSLAGVYRTVLRGKRVLLLMDNARDAAQVAPLLPAPEGCLMLVTSRRHIVLPGLKPIDLERLPEEDAVKLLRAIAGERIEPLEREIARQCGCLPLALRAAASLLRERPDLDVGRLYARLQDAKRMLALKDASRDLTVEAVLQTSYELLSADLRQKWRCLAAFPGSFDVKAAGAVWQMDQDAAQDALGELLCYSLLEFDEKTQRWSLHDLARLFAIRQLTAEESRQASLRHAEHFVRALSAAK